MKIGVPKEIKNNESRVALTPGGVQTMVKNGHTVYIETNAGLNSGLNDEQYLHAGAHILSTAKEVFDIADMIMKVKEPIPQEYGLIHPNQLIFTYFHFASNEELLNAMIKSKAVCLAYETNRGSKQQLTITDSYVGSRWTHVDTGRCQVPRET